MIATIMVRVGAKEHALALDEMAQAQLVASREDRRGLATQLALVLAPLEHKLAPGWD